MRLSRDPDPSQLPLSETDGDEPHSDSIAGLHDDLRALARALVVDPSQAEDVVQEAWIVAMSQPRGSERGFAAWMRGVVRNLARRSGRDDLRRREIEALAGLTDPTDTADALEARIVDQMSAYRALRGLTETLRSPERAVIALHYFEGLSIEEVARALGRPVETVRTQRRRALQQLRAELDRRGSKDRSTWMAWLLPWKRSSPESTASSFTLRAAGVLVVLGACVALWFSLRDPEAPRISALSPGDGTPVTPPAALAPTALEGERVAVTTGLPAQPAPSLPHVRRLTVRVITPSGQAVPNARVSYVTLGDVQHEAQADESGVAQVEVGASDLIGEPFVRDEIGGIAVSASADHAAASHVYYVALPPEGRAFDVPLGGPGEDLALEVLDPTGAPLANTEVIVDLDVSGPQQLEDGTLHTEVVFACTTDATGLAKFTNLVRRDHLVLIIARDFPTVRVNLAGGTPAEVHRLRLKPGGEVVGLVRDPDGQPAGGAIVRCAGDPMLDAYAPRALTDEGGAFRMTGVPAGRHWIFARDAGGERHVARAPVVVESGRPTTCELHLTPAQSLVVRLRDERGHDGGSVVIFASSASGEPAWMESQVPDSSAEAEFVELPDCALELYAYDARNQAVLARITLARDERAPIELVVPAHARADLATLGGTLLDERGLPFETSAVIYALSPDANTPNASAFVELASGRFDALRAPSGKRRVFAIVADGVVDAGEIELEAGAVRDLGTIRAAPTGLLRIERDVAGPRDVRVEVFAELRFEAHVYTRTIASLPRERDELALRPGRYKLRTSHSINSTPTSPEFEIRPNEVTRVRLP